MPSGVVGGDDVTTSSRSSVENNNNNNNNNSSDVWLRKMIMLRQMQRSHDDLLHLAKFIWIPGFGLIKILK